MNTKKIIVGFWPQFPTNNARWLDANLDKPKKGTLVILAHVDDNPENQWMVAGTWSGKKFWNQFMNNPKWDAPCYPTHWMPFPAKAEAEAKAKRDEQARIDAEIKAKALAEKKAKAAPDKEKLLLLVGVIAGIEMPTLNSDEAKTILQNVNTLLGKVVTYIEENTEKL